MHRHRLADVADSIYPCCTSLCMPSGQLYCNSNLSRMPLTALKPHGTQVFSHTHALNVNETGVYQPTKAYIYRSSSFAALGRLKLQQLFGDPILLSEERRHLLQQIALHQHTARHS